MTHATFARAALGLVALAAALGCDSSAGGPQPTLDALLGERIDLLLEELPARVPLAEGEDFRVVELGRTDLTSHHVAAIRTAEPLHRHERHDLLVVLVRGYGTQRLGEKTQAVGEGSVLFVPRGAPHAFTNGGPEPAIAYVVYAPPFDGSDRVPVSEGEAP